MNFSRRPWKWTIGVLGAGLLFLPAAGLHAEQPLKLGIHPYLSSSEITRRYSPLADYLGKELGRRVTIEIANTYTAHIKALGTNSVDIALMGPSSYVLLTREYGKRPILAVFESNGNKTFRGVIIAKKDSPISSISQLKGKTFAFGDKASTMGHLAPRSLLLKKGVDVRDLAGYDFLANHQDICIGVLAGAFDAGAVKEDVFHEYEQKGLKAIAFSPPINDHVFVASAGLPLKTVRFLQKALLHLGDRPEGKQILSLIQKNLGSLLPADDREYDSLRNIMLELDKAGVEP